MKLLAQYQPQQTVERCPAGQSLKHMQCIFIVYMLVQVLFTSQVQALQLSIELRIPRYYVKCWTHETCISTKNMGETSTLCTHQDHQYSLC